MNDPETRRILWGEKKDGEKGGEESGEKSEDGEKETGVASPIKFTFGSSFATPHGRPVLNTLMIVPLAPPQNSSGV